MLTPADLVSTLIVACSDLYTRLSREETEYATRLHYPSRRELINARQRAKLRQSNVAALRVLLPLLQRNGAEVAIALREVLLLYKAKPKAAAPMTGKAIAKAPTKNHRKRSF